MANATPNSTSPPGPRPQRASSSRRCATILVGMLKKVRSTDLRAMKERGERIAMLTAYDAAMARILDRAGMDVLLVGDSLGMVVMGYETTVPVTLEMIIHHSKAVTRGISRGGRALVVADMPFLSYQITIEEAM